MKPNWGQAGLERSIGLKVTPVVGPIPLPMQSAPIRFHFVTARQDSTTWPLCPHCLRQLVHFVHRSEVHGVSRWRSLPGEATAYLELLSPKTP